MECSFYDISEKNNIFELFKETFTRAEEAKEGEAVSDLVVKLIDTTEPSDLIGFSAHENGQLLASIFFSRLIFPSNPEEVAFLLSPVAVHHNYQSQGIGKHLIQFGLEQLIQQKIRLVFTYGDPTFYGKVGFSPLSEAVIKAPMPLSQPEGWLVRALLGDIQPMTDTPKCVPAFQCQNLW